MHPHPHGERQRRLRRAASAGLTVPALSIAFDEASQRSQLQLRSPRLERVTFTGAARQAMCLDMFPERSSTWSSIRRLASE
jgi:hypothetical protein